MKIALRASLVMIGLLGLWQMTVTVWQLPDYILPGPLQVLIVAYQEHFLILTESLTTCIEIGIGLALGILFGCSAALAMSLYRILSAWFLPLLIISQAIPTFAIAPLLVVWFGYGMAAKIVTTSLMIFFPITSAFYDGLKRTDNNLLNLAQTMNANKWRLYWHIRIPAALPDLAAGIRIAAVTAPIGAIIGEWVGASHGLGYLMLNANARTDIDMMFAALLVVMALSLVLYMSVHFLLQKLIWWHGN